MSKTLVPFLYQTRTLQRLSRANVSAPVFRAFHAAPPAAARYNAKDSPYTSKDPIPFDLPTDIEPIEIEEESEPGHESTITPLEKRAFDRIFEEIAAREREALRPPPASTPLLSDDFPSRYPREGLQKYFLKKNPEAEKARKTLNIVVEDAAAAYSDSWRPVQNVFEPKTPVGQSSMARDPAKALLRFPPSLRKAARMALGAVQADRHEDKSSNLEPVYAWEQAGPDGGERRPQPMGQLGRSVQEELMRREERNRVDQKMRSARTDFELWDIIEEEVFPMVEKLGLGEQPAAKRGRKKAIADATSSEDASSTKLSVNIYGPLYPFHLLNALRLLDKGFNMSSPLALNILPRVKELGLASYVLGVSTPFYNTLADIIWRRYGNPAAVFNLFEEMRYAGLYCDTRSLSTIESIGAVVRQGGLGEKGPFMRELMSLPEYEFNILPRAKHWTKTAERHVLEKERDLRTRGKALYEQVAEWEAGEAVASE
ncbi:hypothetical protein B0H67DRAFT_598353 [Lasiosphaeris hirsuta]|uniref:Mtf2-like C-terminal domain-containing protein n=1 Tax=Lasiosphaeris hirsuta TaxID=260670 RepID=A0AA40AZJ8_9PEZI|nr:hypothetical protein B0H67DRAFT_598353 [Lasiosphaeris hirsuta]